MKKCIFPGSFDPFTTGHLDILIRSSRLFDFVTVAVLDNANKIAAFSTEERISFINRAINEKKVTNCSVTTFNMLTVELAKKEGACAIIRGVRSAIDFEYEKQIAAVNTKLCPEIETVLLFSASEYEYISSSAVKELAKYNKVIDTMVLKANLKTITERLSQNEQDI